MEFWRKREREYKNQNRKPTPGLLFLSWAWPHLEWADWQDRLFEDRKGDLEPASNRGRSGRGGSGDSYIFRFSPRLQLGLLSCSWKQLLSPSYSHQGLESKLTYAGTVYPDQALASMPNLAFGNFLLRVPEDLFDLLLESCKGIHFWTVAQQVRRGSAGCLILY